MECAYLLKEDCKRCEMYDDMSIRACWLNKSLDDMKEIIHSNSNPLKSISDLKPYLLSIHNLIELGERKPYWDWNIEKSFRERTKAIVDNRILSIADVSSKNSSYKDTKKVAEKEIEKLKKKIEEITPQLNCFVDLQF